LTQAATRAGATKEEITEALRVAEYISGVGSVYTAAQAQGIILFMNWERKVVEKSM
jgi:alkylhydroperoxidase/carboxymuconolactone decarboxylase family protein YurZ